jgi:hypothetical protein
MRLRKRTGYNKLKKDALEKVYDACSKGYKI